MRFDGKVVFITGAGGYIGGTAARMFAAEGACVAACDINGETVGRRVTPAVSREISDSMRRTLEGRRLGGIVT